MHALTGCLEHGHTQQYGKENLQVLYHTPKLSNSASAAFQEAHMTSVQFQKKPHLLRGQNCIVNLPHNCGRSCKLYLCRESVIVLQQNAIACLGYVLVIHHAPYLAGASSSPNSTKSWLYQTDGPPLKNSDCQCLL